MDPAHFAIVLMFLGGVSIAGQFGDLLGYARYCYRRGNRDRLL